MEQQVSESPEVRTKPKSLIVLCSLTFIWSGINIISSVLIFSFHDSFVVKFAETAKALNFPNWEIFTTIPRAFFLASAIISAGVVTGAFKMLNLQRNGFHIYTIGQILLILSSMFFNRMPGPPWMDVVVSGLFIYLYSRYLKIFR